MANRNKSGIQTKTGKAFEYACLNEIKNIDDLYDVAIVEDSPQLTTAKESFYYLPQAQQNNYIAGAKSAIKIIRRLEPNLVNGLGKLYLSLQSDQKGQEGDVRDVLCVRNNNDWEIGLSCKHNHDAVKHSRLSDQIDFGKEWFDIPCSEEYSSTIKKLFQPLREYRDNSHGTMLWSQIGNKEENVYIPVLSAFINELQSLDQRYPNTIPSRLIQYLIGKKDFYKVIMDERKHITEIESFNINGTLGTSAGSRHSLINIPTIALPNHFYNIGFKDNSNSTVLVVCDNGWNISMRIHNASSRIEPSLKFDVRLIAVPNTVIRQIEPWYENE